MIRLGKGSPAKKISDFAKCSMLEFHGAMKNISTLKSLTCLKQEDAHEFMFKLVDTLSLDMENKGDTKIEFYAVGNSGASLRNARFRQNTNNKVYEDAFEYMIGPEASDPKVQTVAELLHKSTVLNYQGNERLDPTDGKPRDHMQRIFLTGVPRFVRIMVKNIDKTGKVFGEGLVAGVEQLTITTYTLPSEAQQRDVAQVTNEAQLKALMGPGKDHRFNLKAVVAHRGSSPKGGHYVAYLKDASGVWFEHNDSSVREYKESVETIEVRANGSEHAYVYLYQR